MQAGDGTGQRGHVAPKHVWARAVLEWLPEDRVTARE